jgi:hypothetical protein
MVHDELLFAGRFITFPQPLLLNPRNRGIITDFDLQSLLFSSNTVWIGKVCSVVKSSEDGSLECDVDPLLEYKDLPYEFRTDERQRLTEDRATQLFLAEFEYKKPVISINEIHTVANGISWILIS